MLIKNKRVKLTNKDKFIFIYDLNHLKYQVLQNKWLLRGRQEIS